MFLQFSAIGQEMEYRVHASNVRFDELVNVLESGYDVTISYKSDLLADELFSIKSNTPNLSDILNEISALYPLEFQILNDRSILLREKLKKRNVTNSSIISIQVLDSITNMAIESAAVGIKETGQGEYTNEKGIALLNKTIPESGLRIEIHMLGYMRADLNINKAGRYIVKIVPQTFTIDEVLINDRKDFINNDVNEHVVILNTNHISSMISGVAGRDVLRQAQLLPGVSAFNDKSAGLQIRGGEEQTALIEIDHIPVYNSGHYYGLFSTVNSNYTTTSVLYKNNLPMTHDGKTSGMLQVSGPKPDTTKKYKGSADIDLFSVSGGIGLNLNKNLSLFLAGRTSHSNVSETDLFSLFSNPVEEAVLVQNFSESTRNSLLSSVPGFKFHDLNGKLKYNWNNGSVDISYFESLDDVDDTFTNTFLTRRMNVVVTNEEKYSNLEVWKNKGASVDVSLKLKDNFDFNVIGYYSNYDNQSGLEIAIDRSFLNQNLSNTYTNNRGNNVQDLGIQGEVTYSGLFNQISFGAEYIDHTIGLNISEQGNIIRNNEGSAGETSLFASVKTKNNWGLTIEGGIRGSWYRRKFYPSPRINLALKNGDDLSFKAAFGRHNQFVRQITFENIFGRNLDFWRLSNNNDIPVSKSDNMMLGLLWTKGRFNLDIESYFRKTYDVLELALVNPRSDAMAILPVGNNGNTYEFFKGDSQTLGIDILASTTLKNYSGWISYTLSKSIINYDRIARGSTFPTQDDRRHQLKFINEYKVGNFSFGTSIIYASGRPYTDLTKIGGQIRRSELRAEDRISYLPHYFRTDLGVNYVIDLGYSTATIGLSAYNLLNRNNVNYVQYLFSVDTNTASDPMDNINALLGTESNLLGRTINLNLSASF